MFLRISCILLCAIGISKSALAQGQREDNELRRFLRNCEMTEYVSQSCRSLLNLKPLNDLIKNSKSLTRNGAHKSAALAVGDPSSTALATKPPTPTIEPNRFAIRADDLDNFFYAFPASAGGAGQAKAASISYTDNFYALSATGAVSHTQSITLNGISSYTLQPRPFRLVANPDGSEFEWASTTWLYGNGAWDTPTKPNADYSIVRSGFDVQFHYASPTRPTASFIDDVYFKISPYVQSDYYGKGRGEGVNFAVSPVISALNLGEARGDHQYLNWFWVARAETIVASVDNPGQTLLTKGEHNWTGGEARVYFMPFPSAADPTVPDRWSPWLQDRFLITASATFLDDTRSINQIAYYSAAVQYKLSGCNTKADKAACSQGSSSVSVEYDTGTDPDTLAKSNKILGKLNYSY
jgi:hypothetical protein